MTEERKKVLCEAGISVEEALERFMGNEMLLERFLKKFAEDTNYEKLLQAMEEQDQTKAFESAHTLKGVCGNLSMKELYRLLEQQVDLLRNGDLTGAQELMPALTQAYEKIRLVI